MLKDLLIIFTIAILVVLVFSKLKVPALVGFLLTGIIAGPHGFGLVTAVHEVEIMAEIGVILLLFTIGIEFSLKTLLNIKKVILLGGGLQVFLTAFLVTLIIYYSGRPINQSIFIGFVVSLSSTAILLKLLHDKAEVDSQHGRNAFAILIFQDIIVIPMILLVPLLAGSGNNSPIDFLIISGKAIAVILISYFLARFLIPKLLYLVAGTRSNELFLLSVIAICFSIAGLTNYAGLSLAFGAFLAGLLISESEYSYQAISKILPFRDIFTSLFFVSIGMLLNVNFFLQQPLLIVMLVIGVIVLKAIIVGFISFVTGYPFRTNILTALGLAQIGEFSFILAGLGLKNTLISDNTYQLILSVAIITMGATPFIFKLAPKLSDILLKLPLPPKLRNGLNPVPDVELNKVEHHLIIVGYGINGKNVSLAARHAGIPYVIIEMNPATVRQLYAENEKVIYGDASQEGVLKHALIENAMVVVVAVPDLTATLRITQLARQLNQAVHIIVRTRDLFERENLHQLGANEVIPAEFETSIEIFSRVLTKYLVPMEEIERMVTEVRASEYEMLRSFSPSTIPVFKCHYSDMEITTIKVEKDASIIGYSMSKMIDSDLKINLLGIRRSEELHNCLEKDFSIQFDDILILMGTPEDLNRAVKEFKKG